jgi:hypothetical protein
MCDNTRRVLKVNLAFRVIKEELCDDAEAQMFLRGARPGVAGRAGIPTNEKLTKVGLI